MGQEMPAYLVVGRLRRPHSLDGSMLMEVLTDFPERLQPAHSNTEKKLVYVGEEHIEMHISKLRWHNQAFIVNFDGMNHRDQVDGLRNKLVYTQTSDLPDLPEGEYYHHQLLGLSIIEKDTGIEIGKLREILETGANDVYIIDTPEDKDILLPAIESVILEVNLDERRIFVCSQEWL